MWIINASIVVTHQALESSHGEEYSHLARALATRDLVSCIDLIARLALTEIVREEIQLEYRSLKVLILLW